MFLNADVDITNELLEQCVAEATQRGLDAASPLSKSGGYNKPLPSFASLLVEFSPLRNITPEVIFRKKTLFGGALLIKSEVFFNMSGWDERFFVWFEDSDLTKRLHVQGAQVGWLHYQVGHKGGASFTGISHARRSAIFFSVAFYLS
ncbi:MAG: hypothetical protein UZ22_OP11002000455 [Microgenomates bacterium OLB23]|nr:MAG: hypothetical protein UZ22_OP11002000455 [Microgenomates bacterium OLB23]